MTLNTNDDGLRLPITKKLTTTNLTNLVAAAPSRVCTIEALSICNISGSTATISISVNDGTTSFFILNGYSITSKQTTFITEFPLKLNNSMILQAQASAADAFDIVGSYVQSHANKGQPDR